MAAVVARRGLPVGAHALAGALAADAGAGRVRRRGARGPRRAAGRGSTTRSAAGVDPAQLILDPGLGFAKRAEHNWRLAAHLDDLMALGFPVLFGASRKSYLGSAAGRTGRHAAPGRPAGGGHGRDQRAGRAGRRLGGPGARRPRPRWTPWPSCARPEARPVTGDTITLTGLRAYGHHGVFDFERAKGQDFVVDVVLELDLGPAAGSRRRDRHGALRRAGRRPGRDRDRRAGEPVGDAGRRGSPTPAWPTPGSARRR